MKLEWKVSDDGIYYTASAAPPGLSGGVYTIRLLGENSPRCALSYRNHYTEHPPLVIGEYKNPSVAMVYAQADLDEG